MEVAMDNKNNKVLEMNNNNDELNYRDLLGEQNWQRLHPAIKLRFSHNKEQAVIYKGVMKQVYSSFSGKAIAQICRLIGTPLALYSGKNIPIEVKVYPNKKLGGMTWDRFYSFPNKLVNRVKSTKCIQGTKGLVEMVGGGFGMKLKVYEKDSALYFESTHFFWQLGNFTVLIPDILSPGKTLVVQEALNDNQFRFRLEVTHSLLGKMFKQVGIFEQAAEC
jgi:hypothetical protein